MPRTNRASLLAAHTLLLLLEAVFIVSYARSVRADIADSELRAELPEGSDPAVSLACVTAYASKNGFADSGITNQRNVAVADINEVFSYKQNPDDTWGLFCKDGWTANGCSSAWMNSPKSGNDFQDKPLRAGDNGCEMTNPIANSVHPYIYLNCCKFTSTLKPEDLLGIELAGPPVDPPVKPGGGDKMDPGKKGKLALGCVTASVTGPKESTIRITSQINTEVQDWQSAFVFDPYVDGEDPWGLRCRNDWVFASCVSSTTLMPRNSPTHEDWAKSKYSTPDTLSTNNACRTDDEELWDGTTLFATCCKLQIVKETQ